METATLVAAGWTTGINAYLTVLMLGLAGRFGWAETPAELQQPWVLALAAVLFAIEFVIDKVPLLDSAWDVVHTVVRPSVAAIVGALSAAANIGGSLGKPQAALLAGGLALAAHLSKTSTRLAINVSPEPFTNIAASLAEDGLVAALVSLALIRPRLAAFLAAVAAAASLLIGFALFSVARRGYRRVRRLLAHWAGRTGGTPGPVVHGRAPPGAGSLH